MNELEQYPTIRMNLREKTNPVIPKIVYKT